MRVLIFTFGTRGDIDPFAALAERLSASGHVAVLAAPEPYRDGVPSGVGFEPMATEMDRVMRAGMANLSGPAQALTLARQMLAAMRTSLHEQWEIAQRVQPTIIVAHPKALGGLHIAERLGVPFVPSLPLPFLTPTNAFPIPFLARPLPWRLNRVSYQFNRVTALAYGGMINQFRRERLGLPRMSRLSDYLTMRGDNRAPVLYPFSRHVVPVPGDYPATANVTGYWFRETTSTWADPRLPRENSRIEFSPVRLPAMFSIDCDSFSAVIASGQRRSALRGAEQCCHIPQGTQGHTVLYRCVGKDCSRRLRRRMPPLLWKP